MSDAAVDEAGLKATVLIAYGLFVLALFNGVTAIAGVILLYLKRGEARGTLWEGHFRNLIHVFWIAAVVAAIFLAVLLQSVGGLLFSLAATDGNPPPLLIGWLLALVPAFYLAGVVFVVWYLYRTLGGAVRALEGRPY